MVNFNNAFCAKRNSVATGYASEQGIMQKAVG